MHTVTVLSLVSIIVLSDGWAKRQSFSPRVQLPRWYSRHTWSTKHTIHTHYFVHPSIFVSSVSLSFKGGGEHGAHPSWPGGERVHPGQVASSSQGWHRHTVQALTVGHQKTHTDTGRTCKRHWLNLDSSQCTFCCGMTVHHAPCRLYCLHDIENLTINTNTHTLSNAHTRHTHTHIMELLFTLLHIWWSNQSVQSFLDNRFTRQS